MKKILYGTTALIAAGMISTAVSAAEPIKLQLGGFMDWYVASTKQESDYKAANAGTEYNDFDVMGNGEIYFLGETMLDSGIKVGVNVQLETGTRDEVFGENRATDENFATVDTAYGRLILGATRNAASKMHVSAPDAGRLGIEESYIYDLVEAPAAIDRLDATWLNTDGRTNKISYITPTLYGLTMGATWTPGSDSNANRSDVSIQQTGAFKEGYALNLMYSEEFAGIGLTSTAAYGNYSVGGEERQGEYSLGTKLSYAGFSFGGAYRMVSDHTDNTGWNGVANRAEGTDSVDGYVYNVGAGYEAGPYAVSLNYMKSEVEGVRPTQAQRVANADQSKKDEVESYQLSGKYNLGAGVDTFATVAHVEYQDEARNTNANNNKGYAFVTGIALAF